MANQQGTNFRDHYLQIQALTPSEPQANQSNSNSQAPNLQTALLPGVLFVAVLSIGLIAFLASRFKTGSYLTGSFKLALALAVIPLGLSLITLSTNLTSRAGPNQTPQNLTVPAPNRDSFSVSWTTTSPTHGAARISTSPTMNPVIQTLSSPLDQKITSHQFTFKGLQSGTTYYLDVYSEGIWYSNQGSPMEISIP